MKKTMVYLSIILVFLCLTGCTQKEILIGFSGNLTGSGSEIAVSALYGVEMAVREVNEAGGVNGRKIKLMIEDDENDVLKAQVADETLIKEGAVAIIGHTLSSMGEMSIPNINRKGVVMVSPSISSTQYIDSDDYFYSVTPNSNIEAARLAEAISQRGYTSVGLLYQEENKTYSHTFISEVSSQYKQQGSVVFEQAFSTSDKSSYAAMSELVAKEEIDALVIAGNMHDVAQIAQQLYILDAKLAIFMPAWGMGQALLDEGGPTVEGAYAVNAYDVDDPTPAFTEFKAQYTKKFGTQPPFSAVYGYEAAMLLFEAIEGSDSLESQDIKASLDSITTIQGLQGEFSMDSEGDVLRDIHLYQIIDGAFIRLD